MINALIIDYQSNTLDFLMQQLRKYCPQVAINARPSSKEQTCALLQDRKHRLLFVESPLLDSTSFSELCQQEEAVEKMIFVSDQEKHAVTAFRRRACGYLLQPVVPEELMSVVEYAETRLREKNERLKNRKMLDQLLLQNIADHPIGIPTMEGFEFISVKEIIRCEGYQKCTRVITDQKTNIVSSYNIGEFRKLLESYGFFAPHKSHLINLKKVRRYNKEGTITMLDNSFVPVSRRRKQEFLMSLPHL